MVLLGNTAMQEAPKYQSTAVQRSRARVHTFSRELQHSGTSATQQSTASTRYRPYFPYRNLPVFHFLPRGKRHRVRPSRRIALAPVYFLQYSTGFDGHRSVDHRKSRLSYVFSWFCYLWSLSNSPDWCTGSPPYTVSHLTRRHCGCGDERRGSKVLHGHTHTCRMITLAWQLRNGKNIHENQP